MGGKARVPAARVVRISSGTEHYWADARYCDACSSALAGPDGCADFKQVTCCSSAWWVRRAVMERPGGVMDELAGDGPMAVFGAAVPLGIGAEGRPLLAPGGCNGAGRIWDLHCDIERSKLARARPDAGLTDSGRSWAGNFSLMPVGRAPSSCAISQLSDAHVSEVGLQA
jgi:hypothetical protein